MYLIVLPTKIAEDNDLTTQDSLGRYLSNLNINIEQNYSGVGDETLYDQDGIRSFGLLVMTRIGIDLAGQVMFRLQV